MLDVRWKWAFSLLHDGQNWLTAVVLQAEKNDGQLRQRQTVRQNCGADIKIRQTVSASSPASEERAFPNKGINFATAAKRFKALCILI
jgi:hypothetical protein